MLLLLALSAPASAQDPSQPWATVTTEHFRLHYPVAAEAWATHVAQNLEDWHHRVEAEVGVELGPVVDVVVQDPFGQANGFAITHLRLPRVSLFATAPEVDSVIGHFGDWAELLMVHEQAHVVHLTIPSRNQGLDALMRVLGFGPLAVQAPRWVTEGYATVVEGRRTPTGRPNAHGRAVFLRTLALSGTLPTYEELDGVDRWMGGSMAYLVGSAFLEWLEARHPGSLRDLWRALSAVQRRDLDEAFGVVYGLPPRELYQRFVAETTAAALALEAARSPRPDTLWAVPEGYTGRPALSPDGTRLALVLQPLDAPARLLVLDTTQAAADEALREWEEGVDEALEEDPEDVRPVRPSTWPHEPVYERVDPGRSPVDPRWLRDGSGLLFTAWQPLPGGSGAPDLFLWTLPDEEAGQPSRERRVTRGASVKSADPHPDGTWAVAVEDVWGVSRVVRVELADGTVTPITEGSPTAVVRNPRLDPVHGTRLAYLRLAGDSGWSVVVRGLADGTERVLDVGGRQVGSPAAWLPDGSGLVVTLGEVGFQEAWLLDPEGQRPPQIVTRTQSGAASPEVGPEGELYYLGLTSVGPQVHREPRLALSTPPDPGLVALAGGGAVVPPARPEPPVRTPVTSPAAEPYRASPQSVNLLLGGLLVDQRTWTVEGGLRVGDVVGRSELLVLGGWGEGHARGGLVGWGWHRLPVDLHLTGFGLLGSPVGGGAGGGLHGVWAPRFPGGGARVAGGAFGSTGGSGGWLEVDAGHRAWLGTAFVDVRGSLAASLATDGALALGGGHLRLGADAAALELGGRVGTSPGTLTVGGQPSSLLPDGLRLRYVPLGAFGADHVVTRTFDLARVGLVMPQVGAGLVAERLRPWDEGIGAGGRPLEPTTVVSVQAALTADREPLLRLPPVSLGAGLGCAVEVPGDDGLRERACRDAEHWRGWLHVTWVP